MKGKKFIAMLFVFWFILALVSLPYFLRVATVHLLQKETGLEVFLAKTTFRPPSTFVFSDLRLSWKERERLKIDQATIVLRWKSLFSETIKVEKVVVEDPFLRLQRYPNGSVDLFRFFAGRPKRETAQKRKILIESLSVTGGEVEFWDGKVQKEPYPVRLSSLTVTAEELLFPPQPLDSSVTLQTFVGVGHSPPSGSLKLKGSVNLKEGDFKLSTELREIDLPAWSPYTATLPVTLETGRLDLDGEVRVRQKALWGYGMLHLRDLALRRTGAATLFETVFGVSQETLISFLENSHGELAFPIKVSGQLTDPKFELGELFTESIRQSLARTLPKGIGEMIKAGSGTLEITDLEKRAKRVVKEVEKSFRLDWLLTHPPPQEVPETLPTPSEDTP